MRKKNTILAIGPRIPRSGNLGGVVVSFEQFLDELKQRNINYQVIDTNKKSYRNFISAMLLAGCRFMLSFYGAKHISMHLQNNDYVYIAPLVVAATRISGKTISLYKFAGNFDEIYDSLGLIRQKMICFSIKNADQCFFQTQYLVKKFCILNKNTYWLPNSRPCHGLTRNADELYKKRLIFMGRICKEKGIDEILQASLYLDDSYRISIYGVIEDDRYATLDWSKHPNISYRGQIPASSVSGVLSKHDILLLPSYWPGEGYPGVIVEALQAGLPVIACRSRGIEEMITDGVEGHLIEPRNVTALVNAVRAVDDNTFNSMSMCARRRAQAFNSESVTSEFLDKIGFVR